MEVSTDCGVALSLAGSAGVVDTTGSTGVGFGLKFEAGPRAYGGSLPWNPAT